MLALALAAQARDIEVSPAGPIATLTAGRTPSSPHQTTADQFYDEAQCEAYRASRLPQTADNVLKYNS